MIHVVSHRHMCDHTQCICMWCVCVCVFVCVCVCVCVFVYVCVYWLMESCYWEFSQLLIWGKLHRRNVCLFFKLFDQFTKNVKREREIVKNIETGVNFINILRTNFSYERHFVSFFLVTCTLRVWCLYKKRARIKLMKLTAGASCCKLK